METKFQKFQNELPSIFALNDVQFVEYVKNTYCVRSFRTGMFCGCELRGLISLCDSLDLNFYVRSNTTENRIDCVEFVIY